MKQKIAKLPREPGFIKQAWIIAYERAQTRRALRLLDKQEWSIDFLTALLIRASRIGGRPLELTLHNKEGLALRVSTTEGRESSYKDDSIFNHLDDELRVRQFITQVNKR